MKTNDRVQRKLGRPFKLPSLGDTAGTVHIFNYRSEVGSSLKMANIPVGDSSNSTIKIYTSIFSMKIT